MSEQGASANEQLLMAARTDSEELILEVLDGEADFDINFQDGLGLTALHHAVKNGSTDVLEHILEADGCDVDLQTRMDKSTPLHLAVACKDSDLRKYLVGSLLEAGASTSIKNKYSEKPIDLIPINATSESDIEIRAMLQEQTGKAMMFDASDFVDEQDEGEASDGSED